MQKARERDPEWIESDESDVRYSYGDMLIIIDKTELCTYQYYAPLPQNASVKTAKATQT